MGGTEVLTSATYSSYVGRKLPGGGEGEEEEGGSVHLACNRQNHTTFFHVHDAVSRGLAPLVLAPGANMAKT